MCMRHMVVSTRSTKGFARTKVGEREKKQTSKSLHNSVINVRCLVSHCVMSLFLSIPETQRARITQLYLQIVVFM